MSHLYKLPWPYKHVDTSSYFLSVCLSWTYWEKDLNVANFAKQLKLENEVKDTCNIIDWHALLRINKQVKYIYHVTCYYWKRLYKINLRYCPKNCSRSNDIQKNVQGQMTHIKKSSRSNDIQQSCIYPLKTFNRQNIVCLYIIFIENIDLNVKICCKFKKLTHPWKRGQGQMTYGRLTCTPNQRLHEAWNQSTGNFFLELCLIVFIF